MNMLAGFSSRLLSILSVFTMSEKLTPTQRILKAHGPLNSNELAKALIDT
jgi:hypothetical protein